MARRLKIFAPTLIVLVLFNFDSVVSLLAYLMFMVAF